MVVDGCDCVCRIAASTQLHALFCRFPQFHGTERVSLDCAHTNDRSPSDFLGLFVHSISVLLALHRLVRHVHYLYSSLCIPIPAYGDGADWRY
ncbi:Uncharacterised protein [Vibrio cholerae]|nr:Uncharacterised protein [Vibrio cholerae]